MKTTEAKFPQIFHSHCLKLVSNLTGSERDQPAVYIILSNFVPDRWDTCKQMPKHTYLYRRHTRNIKTKDSNALKSNASLISPSKSTYLSKSSTKAPYELPI